MFRRYSSAVTKLSRLNIHTTGEERDRILAAINDYNAAHPTEKDAAFEAAKAQVIPLRCAAGRWWRSQRYS